MKQFIKRAQSLAFAFAMLLSVGVTAMPTKASAAASLTATPKVTFTFDDGFKSSLINAAPALAEYGFSGTNYVITDCVGMETAPNACKADGGRTYMSWDDLRTLRDQYGWNIGSHTASHAYLASTGGGEQAMLTPAEVSAELANSKQAIAANLDGYNAVDFAAPYGDYDNTVLAEAARHYVTLRGFADIGPNVWPYNDRLVVNQPVEDTAGETTAQTVARIKGVIDTAAANNQWVVLTFHEITAGPSSGDPDKYEFPASGLAEIAAYVKSKNIAVVHPHAALVNGDVNMLGDGSFDNNTISTDWANRNSAALVNSWVTDDQTGLLVRKDAANNGSYLLGKPAAVTNSLYISAGASAAHVWAPRVAVNPNTTYVVKGYFNILTMTPTATVVQPEVAYRVEEFNAAGAPLRDLYVGGAVRYNTENANANNANKVKNANFAYKPSADAAFARVYIDVQGGAGITGYVDNLEMFDPNATTPGTKVGDIDGNGVVNNDDATILFANWGAAPQAGDINNNGVVDNDDATLLFANWSK